MPRSPRGKTKKRLELTWLPIESVTPYASNPRLMTDSAVVKVAASIKAFGWKQPIVVDEEGVIVVGHTRYAGALRLGLTEVPCVIADDLTPAEAKAYRLADNRTAQETSWDYALLNLELGDIASDLDLTVTGFDDWELTGLSQTGDGKGGGTGFNPLEDTDIEGGDVTRLRVIVVFEDEVEQAAFFDRLGVESVEGKVLYRYADLV